MLDHVQQYTVWIPFFAGIFGLIFMIFDHKMPSNSRRLVMGLCLAFAGWGFHFAQPIHTATDAITYALTGLFGCLDAREAIKRLWDSKKIHS
jgi:hypothetical protein